MNYSTTILWAPMIGLHTSIFRSGLGRSWTRFSKAHDVARHHPELVLHPCVQTDHSGSQHIAVDNLRH